MSDNAKVASLLSNHSIETLLYLGLPTPFHIKTRQHLNEILITHEQYPSVLKIKEVAKQGKYSKYVLITHEQYPSVLKIKEVAKKGKYTFTYVQVHKVHSLIEDLDF